jgi:hypothetical protein
MSRRTTDPVALGAGLFFLAVTVLWLISRVTTLGVAAVGWALAGGLVLLGLAGIAGSLRGLRRRHAGDPDR